MMILAQQCTQGQPMAWWQALVTVVVIVAASVTVIVVLFGGRRGSSDHPNRAAEVYGDDVFGRD
jgi:hypothetical protein